MICKHANKGILSKLCTLYSPNVLKLAIWNIHFSPNQDATYVGKTLTTPAWFIKTMYLLRF